MSIIEKIRYFNNNLRDNLESIQKQINECHKKQDLFKEVVKKVKAHHRAEEKVFYGALIKKEAARFKVYLSIEEHSVLEHILEDLQELPLNEDEWKAKFTLFYHIDAHHLNNTFQELIELAEKFFSPEDLEKMSCSYEEELKKQDGLEI